MEMSLIVVTVVSHLQQVAHSADRIAFVMVPVPGAH
jgi:hypothetical protein